MPHWITLFATALFAVAVIHTFFANSIAKLSKKFPEGSIAENFFHFLSEVEIVFGFWAFVFAVVVGFQEGAQHVADYLDKVRFQEPVFVFVIMCMAATKPVTDFARMAMMLPLRMMPLRFRAVAFYFICLTIGPLLGSFITEPAAMTVTALMLRDVFFTENFSKRFKYITLALLFVNISIGGVLTPYAAPPIIMVAHKWNWDLAFVFSHFGFRSFIAVMISAAVTTAILRKQIVGARLSLTARTARCPYWLMAVHISFIVMAVSYHNQIPFVAALFLIFLGWANVSKKYQEELRLKESLLVGFFLAGLVILGNFQEWWISPLITSLKDELLFWSATGLTALTDNAALTYLGSLVSDISDASKYALVEGAITGGGLTIIANAPNPAGYGILKPSFGEEGIDAMKLFVAALPYTIFAAVCFRLLPA